MQKNLSKDCFSGLIPQNELIELGLTHQFDSIDLDMADMYDRAAMMGKKFACQFFKSANIKVGCFDLPLEIGGSPEEFAETLKKAATVAELAKEVGAQRCRLNIARDGEVTYHSNFERHKQQIAELADLFAQSQISIGLAISPVTGDESAHQFVSKPDELLTLAKMVGKPNVGIVLDTGAWQQNGGTIESVRKLRKEQVVDVVLCSPGAEDRARVLPVNDGAAFCVDVLKFLSESDYAGTISVSGDPSEFESAKAIDVAARLNQTYHDLCVKAGLIEAPPEPEAVAEETPTAAV